MNVDPRDRRPAPKRVPVPAPREGMHCVRPDCEAVMVKQAPRALDFVEGRQRNPVCWWFGHEWRKGLR